MVPHAAPDIGIIAFLVSGVVAPYPGEFWSFLDCRGHAAWSRFRDKMPAWREAGFAYNSSLLHEADFLLATHGSAVQLGRFAFALQGPEGGRYAEDCVYGLFTALFLRGRHLLATGDVAAAKADWDMALLCLGRELGLDFMESTSWAVRSADLLLAYPRGGIPRVVIPAEMQAMAHQPAAPVSTPHDGPSGLRAVDPHCAFWTCGVPASFGSFPAFVRQGRTQQPIVIAVYGYHPVLIEPVSTLVFGSAHGFELQWRWYGVQERDCLFFQRLCNAQTHRRMRQPVPSEWRFRTYESSSDVVGVERSYQMMWTEERATGLDSNLILCMELRDAYFLWRVSRLPTIFYPALIFLQDEAFGDFGADEYLRQFDELYHHNVLAHRSSVQNALGEIPPVAIVAQSPYIAENVYYHTQRRVPAVRPLALYVGTHYAPNASGGACTFCMPHTRLLVLCARTRLMMSHACRALFREGRRALPRGTHVRLHVPPGDHDVVHGLSFVDVARFDASVLVPWNIAVTTFAELYATAMPVFVPDELWMARLWPKQMTSYQRAHSNLHRQLRISAEALQHPTPYPSLDRMTDDFPVMLYWTLHHAHLHGLPGVHSFTSIPSLLWQMHRKDVDLQTASAAMRREAKRALDEVVPFWAGIMDRLSIGY